MEMENLWTEEEAAPVVRWAVSTLQKKRVTGDGPPFVKLGRSVRYRPADVRDWLAQRVVTSTSERVAA